MTVFGFTSDLYKDREQMIKFLDLISLEKMGRNLEQLLRMELGREYQDLDGSDKLRLKKALRDMYSYHVMT